mmetsp:Transcript_838/g.2840  ORF Transcript_838/g.2840 Transcript_838/m.2840 type:complete len:204 (-) Transcript_838:19-630(-)
MARMSPEGWNDKEMMARSNSARATHVRDETFQILASKPRHPDAKRSPSKGWNFTVQGVRGWPTKVASTRPVAKSTTLTVWSPCVDANVALSGENAMLIVDFVVLGRPRYRASQCITLRSSASSRRKIRSPCRRHPLHAATAARPQGYPKASSSSAGRKLGISGPQAPPSSHGSQSSPFTTLRGDIVPAFIVEPVTNLLSVKVG